MFRASASKSCTVVSSTTAKDRSCFETWGLKYPPMCLVPSRAPERPASVVLGAGWGAAFMGVPVFSLSAAANLLIVLPFFGRREYVQVCTHELVQGLNLACGFAVRLVFLRGLSVYNGARVGN